MYDLRTTQGHYAVKLLNPEIMQRPDALANYRTAEAFEALLEAQSLPILPALTLSGRKLQCIDGQYLYVFPYYEGRVLKDEEITPAHCAAMGAVLARIHTALPPKPAPTPKPVRIDWTALTANLLANDRCRPFGEQMHEALPMLHRITEAANAALPLLPPEEVLCHNDMDAKNVLWQGEDFRIIDLECLGYANPGQETVDLAISWAGPPAEEEKFKAFLCAYRAAGGRLSAPPAALIDSRRNYIDWLAYNARRILFDDLEESRLGCQQIPITLEKLASDQQRRETLLRWMEEVLEE